MSHLWPALPPMILDFHIARAVVFPVDGFFDRQLAEAAVPDAAAAGRPIDKRNPGDSIRVVGGIAFDTQTRMVTAIFKKIAG